jgi:hypothetical protein
MRSGKLLAPAYAVICSVLVIFVALRCALVPFSHDEVATFFYYIQPESFWPFYSHPDANGHFLMSATSWLCYRLFGAHPLSLRLPCIASFIVLCYAVWRMRSLFSHRGAWLVLASGTLLSFNFIAFFALCRGYGISMAFFVLALYYFFACLKEFSPRRFCKSLLFFQVALAANLTLLPSVMLCSLLLLLLAIRIKKFTVPMWVALVLHAGLIVYWARFGMYLKEQGALYYGAGESYLQVTFRSLISTIAFDHALIFVVVAAASAFIVFRVISAIRAHGVAYAVTFPGIVAFFIFVVLVSGFYLLKKIAGVNYPEDRTALFFYIFFLLALAWMADGPNKVQRVLLWVVPIFFAAHFAANANLRVHPWPIYETIPVRFIDHLVEAQKKTDRKLTIAGHRVYEFFYGFLNYLEGGQLNHCTSPESLQMNCDYAIAPAADSVEYKKYYVEVERDDFWGFRLLRRRLPITRTTLFESRDSASFVGEGEYHNAFEILDTNLSFSGPLQASFEAGFKAVPVPFNGWLVLQADAVSPDSSMLVRVPLNLVRHDWNGMPCRLDIVTGNAPSRIKRLVAYLWNIDKKPVDLRFTSFRLYRLEGEGVKEAVTSR